MLMERPSGHGAGRGAAAARAERKGAGRRVARPDPFEDIPAPPLRLVRPDQATAPAAGPAHPEAEPAPAAPTTPPEPAPRSARVLRMPRDPRPAPAPAPTETGTETETEAAEPPAAPVEAAAAPAAGPDEVFGPPPETEAEAGAGDDVPAPARPAVAAAPRVMMPGAPAPRPESGRRELRRAVLVGAAIALLIVLAALMARSGADDAAAASDAAAPAVATALGSGPVPAEPQTAATPPSETLVRLRLGPGVSEPRRAALSGAVSAAGYGAVEVREMPFPVEVSRIEFFSPEDRDAAEALGRALAPLTGAMPEVRDLAGNSAGEPGRIEAWLTEGAAN